jgi:hypothetical protein
MQKFKVFGGQFSVLDIPTNVALKLSNIRSLENCSSEPVLLDLYDAVKNYLVINVKKREERSLGYVRRNQNATD